MLPAPLQSPFGLEHAIKLLHGSAPGALRDVRVSLFDSLAEDDVEMVRVEGRVEDSIDDGMLHYFAPAPPERRTAFSGSGLPFANARQAFDGTRNRGTLALGATASSASAHPGTSFVLDLPFPNGYYAGLGARHVSPAVHVWYVSRGRRRMSVIQVGEYGAAFRALPRPDIPAHPAHGPTFYQAYPTVARSQEDILRASDYPSRTHSVPPNFWSTRPPV